MKVTPFTGAAPSDSNPNEGRSVNAERLARATAVAQGQAPQAAPVSDDPQVAKAQNSIKKLKMRTQMSTDRHLAPEEPVAPAVEPAAPVEVAPNDVLDTTEQTEEATEETKPLSPQFAALAKQKRALQLKEQELLAKEKALETQSGDKMSLESYRARIKANALSVLMEEGVTYDQLTEQILASNQEGADLQALRAELKAELAAIKEEQTKSLSERDAASEKQVLSQIRKDTDALISQGDEYEMVREAGYAPKVVELIHKTWKNTGEYLEISEAATLIENELLEESLKYAKLKKVQSKLTPAQPEKTQPLQQERPNTKVMRTLTNRDGSSSNTMSKRERAIAAMEGRLK